MKSFCDRVLELSTFIFRRGVTTKLQVLKTLPWLQTQVFWRRDFQIRVWLDGWKGGLHSYVGVREHEPLHDTSHVSCLFEARNKPGSRSRRGPFGTVPTCGRFSSWCAHRWRPMSQSGVVDVESEYRKPQEGWSMRNLPDGHR